MCKWGLYLWASAAGVPVALTIHNVTLPSVAGVAVEGRPVQERSAVNQTVNRTHKTDRLTPTKKPIPHRQPSPPVPAHSRTALVVAISRLVHCQGRSISRLDRSKNSKFFQNPRFLGGQQIFP